jgi:hypothetical protein
MSPSLLTQAISAVTPYKYRSWDCIVGTRFDVYGCKQVYWNNGYHHFAMLFDSSIPVSEMIEKSKAGLDMAIKRAERFGDLAATSERRIA